MVKRKVEVSLLGKRFTVRSDKDEAYLHALANFVTRRFDELQHSTRMQSTHDVALLVALNLADELFQQEDRSKKSRAEVSRAPNECSNRSKPRWAKLTTTWAPIPA